MARFEDHFTTQDLGAGDPGRAIDATRLDSVLTGFLREMPQRQREVFQMSDVQGLSSREIGKILGVSPGGVRAALFKARRALRRKILEKHPEFVEEYRS